MLKYGIISETNFDTGRARVYFDELGITSGWLTLPDSMRMWKKWPINCQVAVEMHDNGEDGEVLHRVIADDEVVPSWVNEHTEGYQFSDGTAVYYDADAKKITINAPNRELEFNCTKLTVTGDIIAGSGKISLIDHLHTSPTGPTGKPISKP
jgi:phage baseplate assembly protein gpV